MLANGKPNVTSVFAVEVGNPNHVIQASAIQILSTNLIDAFFQIGQLNAGKTFLIYASGPNGTSRNLTQLPSGSPTGCPLGNEQGIKVTFKCKGPVLAVTEPTLRQSRRSMDADWIAMRRAHIPYLSSEPEFATEQR